MTTESLKSDIFASSGNKLGEEDGGIGDQHLKAPEAIDHMVIRLRRVQGACRNGHRSGMIPVDCQSEAVVHLRPSELLNHPNVGTKSPSNCDYPPVARARRGIIHNHW